MNEETAVVKMYLTIWFVLSVSVLAGFLLDVYGVTTPAIFFVLGVVGGSLSILAGVRALRR